MNSKIDFGEITKLFNELKDEYGIQKFLNEGKCFSISRSVAFVIFLYDGSFILLETNGSCVFKNFVGYKSRNITLSRDLTKEELEYVWEFLKKKNFLKIPKGVFKVSY